MSFYLNGKVTLLLAKAEREVIGAFARDIVQKLKKLPVNANQGDRQIQKRTVWLELVTLAKQENPKTCFCQVPVVHEMCEDAAHAIDVFEREDMWFEAKQLPVEDRCGLFPSEAACLKAAAEMIFAKVVDIARRS